eukprot:TRINITY_DN2902_c0_g2_i1.p1 TRINITY_DN2902_c0_g2~~TRINITY_DN2902_c0_g2_i1.p1  ORF type:complete len:209 (-),score=24.72 TRINITY_DN2902_c0_g2_i1:70-696(-)
MAPSLSALSFMILGASAITSADAGRRLRQLGSEVSRVGRLVGASCADPAPGLPKYCCNGIMPNADYANTCECNPGWSHDECVCKSYTAATPCHHCMVHLPATNRWRKTFSNSELYDNCATCVGTCKAEFEAGTCATYMADVWATQFADTDPADVLCTTGYLESKLTDDNYPVELKRALFRNPKLTADDEYIQHPESSEWKIVGVGGKR